MAETKNLGTVRKDFYEILRNTEMKDSINLQNLKGTDDFSPARMAVRNRVMGVLKKNFERYGYLPLETSTLCSYELLAYKYAGGAEILKEMYAAIDQGERAIGLRYDLTVPFSRFIGTHLPKAEIRLPFRRYEIGKVYRDGPVKTGRSREFYQCDVDVVGLSGQLVESEFFKMITEAYTELGIRPTVEYNNRKFLSGLMAECGIGGDYTSAAILCLDSYKKHGEEYVRKELKKVGYDFSAYTFLNEYLACHTPEDLTEKLCSLSLQQLNELFAVTDETEANKLKKQVLSARSCMAAYGKEAFLAKLAEMQKPDADCILRTVPDESIDKVFAYLNLPYAELISRFAESDNSDLKEGLAEIETLRSYIEALGISEYCVFMPTLARGLEIYTGTIWEVFDSLGRTQSALGAGGRYDKIITRFMNDGKAYPAVGMSFGLEPICALLTQTEEKTRSAVDLYIIPMGKDMGIKALRLADAFRKNGCNAMVDMTGRKMKFGLDYANNEKIEYVIIYGSNEEETGSFQLKNMFDKEKSKTVTMEQVLSVPFADLTK